MCEDESYNRDQRNKTEEERKPEFVLRVVHGSFVMWSKVDDVDSQMEIATEENHEISFGDGEGGSQ